MSQQAFEWVSKARKVITITQVVSASISLLASLTMAIFITWPKNGGMKSPYRRIIFGLSISDVFQSFALVSGPLSVPSWIARGNDASCKVNGVLLTFGQTALPMYTCFICLYYLCKLKYRMADEEFKHKIEWKVHTFIVLYSIIIAGSALFLGIYNTGSNCSFCHFAATPLGCRIYPEIVGECDATITARVDIYILVDVFIFSFISLSAITVMMVMLYKYANLMKKMARAGNPSQRNQTQTTNISENGSGDIKSADEQEDTTQMEQTVDIAIVYHREIKIQATCYVGAFILTYAPMILCFFILLAIPGNKFHSSSILSRVLLSVSAFFYPIGGLFNILVYARPKVVVLQRNHPECSKLKGLWLVLRAGGEIPETVDKPFCNICCTSPFCHQATCALDRLHENENAPVNTHRMPMRRGRQLNNNNDESPMPLITTGNINSGISESKVEGDTGFVPEEDWSYEEGEVVLDIIETARGGSNGLELVSDLSFSRGDEFDSSNFSFSTEKPIDSLSKKNLLLRKKIGK